MEDLKEMLSDHVYVSYKPATNTVGISARNMHDEEFPRWALKDIDKDCFEEMIQAGLWTKRERKEGPVDEWAEHLKNMVTEAYDAVAKRMEVSRRPSKLWWNEYVAEAKRKAIEHRRKMTRINKRGSAEEREEAMVQYKMARRELREEIRKAKATAWQELMKTINKDPWGKPYRIVMKWLKRAIPTVTETLTRKILEGVLEELFPTILARNEKEEGVERDDEEGREKEWQKELDVTDSQVRKELKGRREGITALDSDGMTRKIWMAAPDDLVSELYNRCLINGEFPRIWKTARLVLILKAVTNDGPP